LGVAYENTTTTPVKNCGSPDRNVHLSLFNKFDRGFPGVADMETSGPACRGVFPSR